MLVQSVRMAVQGAADSVRLHVSGRVLLRFRRARKRLAQCFALNVIILWGSLYLLDKVLLPSLASVLPSSGAPSEASWRDWAVRRTYEFGWVYPLYLLTLPMNAVWYSHIAEDASATLVAEAAGGAPAPAAGKSGGEKVLPWWASLSELLWFTLFSQVMLLHTIALRGLPVVGTALSFLFSCSMHAFLAFAYKWRANGTAFSAIVATCERQWAYMLGFGLPLGLLHTFGDSLGAIAAYAMLYPLHVVVAHFSTPPQLPAGHPQLPVYWSVTWCNLTLLNLLRVATGRNPAPMRSRN